MFLADENINAKIIKEIRNKEVEVISIAEKYSGISDSRVIDLALEHNKIILTEDKDFGEWVFAHNRKDVSVILIRYKRNDIDSMISHLISLLQNETNNLFGKFITISKNKIRIRNLY